MSTTHSARVGLLTDLHYNPDDAADVRDSVQAAIDHFRVTNVEHIVVLGDLIHEGEDFAASHNRLEEALSLFDGLEIPVTHVLGNHDVYHTAGHDIQEITGEDPHHGTISLTDDITGIYLDSTVPKFRDARGRVGSREREWLSKALEATEYAVIFSHHPLYYHDLSDDGHFAQHPEAAFASDKYLVNDIIENHGNVIATVNGHTHLSHHCTYRGAPRFTINALNEERPGFGEPNGSFAVLEVSRAEVKRISHRHGSYESTDSVSYPATDPIAAFGGTFDPIHDGHRQMFRRALEVGDVVVGLTSDDLAEQTRHTDRFVKSFEDRKATLEEELTSLSEAYDRSVEIRKLESPKGIVADDPTITHLIVSPETFSRGEAINETRLGTGLEPLQLEIVDPILADDGSRISSTRIRQGKIDEHGNLLSEEGE